MCTQAQLRAAGHLGKREPRKRSVCTGGRGFLELKGMYLIPNPILHKYTHFCRRLGWRNLDCRAKGGLCGLAATPTNKRHWVALIAAEARNPKKQ